MSFRLRTWLFAITILLVAEDFQYLLKIGDNAVLEQRENAQKNAVCEECEEREDGEGKSEKEEEKKEEKEEKKEKDENKGDDPDALLNACSRRTKNLIRAALYPLSDIAHELETPPPEV